MTAPANTLTAPKRAQDKPEPGNGFFTNLAFVLCWAGVTIGVLLVALGLAEAAPSIPVGGWIPQAGIVAGLWVITGTVPLGVLAEISSKLSKGGAA